MPYEAGTAFLQVVPSFAGVVDAISEEFSRDGEIAAEVFKESFELAIRGLNAQLSLDTRPADERLAELAAEITALHESVGVDITDSEALAKVAFLKGVLADLRSSTNINIGAGLAGELDQISAAASGAGDDVEKLGDDAASAGGNISWMAGLLGVLATTLAPLGALALGGISTLPAILAGLGVGIGAIALAAGPIENAVKFAFTPLINALRPLVVDAILPGIQSGIGGMATVFKALSPFVVTAAKGIGDFASSFGSILSSGAGIFNLGVITQGGVSFMQQLAKAVLAVVPAFLTIGAQATPILAAIGSGVDHLATAFAGWVASGGFESFVQWLKTNGPGIISDISGFVKGFVSFFIAITPIGLAVLGIVGAIGRFISQAAPVIDFLSQVFIWIAKFLTPVGQLILQIKLLVIAFQDAWPLIVGAVSTAWTWLDTNVWQPLVTFFTVTVPGALTTVGNAFSTAWGAIQSAVGSVYSWIVQNVFQPIGTFFTQTIPGWLSAVSGFFASLPGNIGAALGGLWSIITGAFGDLGSWVSQNVIAPVLGFFGTIGKALGTAMSDVAGAISGPFDSAFGAVKKLWNDTVGGFGFTIPGWVPFVGGDSFKIPSMHTGGIVPGVPGSDVLINMQAGEMVIPRSGVAAFTAVASGSNEPSRSLHIEQNIQAFDPVSAAITMQQKSDFAAKTRGF